MTLAADTVLPAPSADAAAHSRELAEHIAGAILDAGGWIPFARYLELALYAPGLGYYAAGARKFGAEGDFVTAPEISPLFARCLAMQAKQVLEATGGDVLELGPGSGGLAADLYGELEALGAPPRNYFLLEVSPDLRERQQSLLAERHPRARVLAYGRTWKAGGFTCVSRASGLTCTNKGGHGWLLSRALTRVF